MAYHKGNHLARAPADAGAHARPGAHACAHGANATRVDSCKGAIIIDAPRQILINNPLNENYNYVENYRLERSVLGS